MRLGQFEILQVPVYQSSGCAGCRAWVLRFKATLSLNDITPSKGTSSSTGSYGAAIHIQTHIYIYTYICIKP